MAEPVIPSGEEGPLLATIETTKGSIVVKLLEHEAPRTVANFVGLATGQLEWRDPKTGGLRQGRPLYDGTTFHRVFPSFMIQAGDPLSHVTDGEMAGVGRGHPGYRFADEFHPGLKFDHPGVVAMANAGRPDTNGSQWFITEVSAPHLNNKHTIFGEVVKGFEIVPKIARVAADEQGRPFDPVVIKRVTIARGK